MTNNTPGNDNLFNDPKILERIAKGENAFDAIKAEHPELLNVEISDAWKKYLEFSFKQQRDDGVITTWQYDALQGILVDDDVSTLGETLARIHEKIAADPLYNSQVLALIDAPLNNYYLEQNNTKNLRSGYNLAEAPFGFSDGTANIQFDQFMEKFTQEGRREGPFDGALGASNFSVYLTRDNRDDERISYNWRLELKEAYNVFVAQNPSTAANMTGLKALGDKLNDSGNPAITFGELNQVPFFHDKMEALYQQYRLDSAELMESGQHPYPAGTQFDFLKYPAVADTYGNTAAVMNVYKGAFEQDTFQAWIDHYPQVGNAIVGDAWVDAIKAYLTTDRARDVFTSRAIERISTRLDTMQEDGVITFAQLRDDRQLSQVMGDLYKVGQTGKDWITFMEAPLKAAHLTTETLDEFDFPRAEPIPYQRQQPTPILSGSIFGSVDSLLGEVSGLLGGLNIQGGIEVESTTAAIAPGGGNKVTELA